MKELNFIDFKVKFVENIFLVNIMSILITNYNSNPFTLGKFEYVINVTKKVGSYMVI